MSIQLSSKSLFNSWSSWPTSKQKMSSMTVVEVIFVIVALILGIVFVVIGFVTKNYSLLWIAFMCIVLLPPIGGTIGFIGIKKDKAKLLQAIQDVGREKYNINVGRLTGRTIVPFVLDTHNKFFIPAELNTETIQRHYELYQAKNIELFNGINYFDENNKLQNGYFLIQKDDAYIFNINGEELHPKVLS